MTGRGRFVALEGGEGAGKSTQARLLAARLRARGLEVIETREPGGSAGAEAIRRLLLEGADDRWTPQAEALLFAAARAEHVARTIRPALARGAWVVSDRFLDSSLAYQGAAMGLGIDAVGALHAFGSGGLLPDRTILLRLGSGEARARARRRDGGADDRIGGRDAAFHDAVARGFETLAADQPGRIVAIEADGAAEVVAARIEAALADLLAS